MDGKAQERQTVLAPMVTVEEAKRITRLSKTVLFALLDKGLIRAIALPSGRVLLSRADLGNL